MNKKAYLLMKLAALQMKHYGVLDPDFVKEAAEKLAADEPPQENWLQHAWRTYVTEPIRREQVANQVYRSTIDMLRNDPQAVPYVASQGPLDKQLFYTTAGSSAAVAALATLLARKKAKQKENR
jgi:hypothetical protein